MTRTLIAGGVPIAFSFGDEGTASVIADAVEGTLRLAAQDWGLAPPGNADSR